MIQDYPLDRDIPLPRQGNWVESVHRFRKEDAVALRAAEACGRPLLIRGKPGVGKSQTARAAAAWAGRPLLSIVIDGRSEAQDLLWRFDAVKRLADAQALQEGKMLAAESAYVCPGVLWWAYDWGGAEMWLNESGQAAGPPVELPSPWVPGTHRTVLLIDEIDKADPDLPNALLDVLANNGFRKPFSSGHVSCPSATRPLTIVTTNEERELPAAFLRRCLVLTLELPPKKEAFCNYLQDMGERHQAVRVRTEPASLCHVMPEAAQRLWDARTELGEQADYLPGLAEYLDLVTALARLYPTAKEQRDRLDDLQHLAYRKS